MRLERHNRRWVPGSSIVTKHSLNLYCIAAVNYLSCLSLQFFVIYPLPVIRRRVRKQKAKQGGDDGPDDVDEEDFKGSPGAAKKMRTGNASGMSPASKAAGRAGASKSGHESWETLSALHSSHMEEYVDMCRRAAKRAQQEGGKTPPTSAAEQPSFAQAMAASAMASALGPFAFGGRPGFPPHPASMASRPRGDPYLDHLAAAGSGSMTEVRSYSKVAQVPPVVMHALPWFLSVWRLLFHSFLLMVFVCYVSCPSFCKFNLQYMQSAWKAADFHRMYEATLGREGMPPFPPRSHPEANPEELLRSMAAAAGYSPAQEGPPPSSTGSPYKGGAAGSQLTPADMPPALREQLMVWMRSMRS